MDVLQLQRCKNRSNCAIASPGAIVTVLLSPCVLDFPLRRPNIRSHAHLPRPHPQKGDKKSPGQELPRGALSEAAMLH